LGATRDCHGADRVDLIIRLPAVDTPIKVPSASSNTD
jgi:hypothetical protein